MVQSQRRGLGGRGEVELRHRQPPQVDQSATRGTWGCVAATHEVAACRVAAPLSSFGTPARCDGAGGGFHQRAARSTAAPRGAGSLHREEWRASFITHWVVRVVGLRWAS